MDLLNLATETIEWPEDDPRVRITVSQLTTLQDAEYKSLLAKMRTWFAEHSSLRLVDIDDWESNHDTEDVAYAVKLVNIGVEWAQNMAALIRVEECVKTWYPVQIPKDWGNPDSYIRLIPEQLHMQWNAAAERVNPLIWRPGTDDDAKKNDDGNESE